jgi:hypothetical protein
MIVKCFYQHNLIVEMKEEADSDSQIWLENVANYKNSHNCQY